MSYSHAVRRGEKSNQTDVAHLRNSRSSGVSRKRRPAKIIADRHLCARLAYHLLAFNKTKRAFVELIEIGRRAKRRRKRSRFLSRAAGRSTQYNPDTFRFRVTRPWPRARYRLITDRNELQRSPIVWPRLISDS